MTLFRPRLHGDEPADVTPADDMPPRPQRGAVNDPEGGWWGMSGIVRPEWDPCGRPQPRLAMPESNGVDE